jgi:hypothetical protein
MLVAEAGDEHPSRGGFLGDSQRALREAWSPLSVSKRSLLAASAAILAVAGAGGAIAGTKLTSPKEESQAVLDDAAAQLGIEPSKLSAALKKAMQNRVDKAVADGRLTKEQGERLKTRIQSDDFPLLLGPGATRPFGPGGIHRGFHRGGPFQRHLDAAASYLGMTGTQLREALRGGKSLAAVAKDKGKSVDGLIDAMTTDAEQKLDEAVAAGRLTKAEKQEMLLGLEARITDLVNGRFPSPPDWHGFRHGAPGFFRPHR